MGTEVDAAQLSLSPVEQGELAQLEHAIEEGQKVFMKVAAALWRIRDGKLYRQTHGTFEAYCQDRWQFSRSYAYDLIAASSVMAGLSGMPDKPQNPRQAVELLPLEVHREGREPTRPVDDRQDVGEVGARPRRAQPQQLPRPRAVLRRLRRLPTGMERRARLGYE